MAHRQLRRITLRARVSGHWPDRSPDAVDDAIRSGHIIVDGRIMTNPDGLVPAGAAVRWDAPTVLAGRRKLGWAIDRFGVDAGARVALDIGASTGGFTSAWLDAGARLVYAVDAGHGQLLGSLRQDSRVRNLERTNVARLDAVLVPDAVDLVSIDVSYLSLTAAVAQVPAPLLAAGAVLLGLVKPMFELRLPTIPDDPETLDKARDVATAGVAAAGWTVRGVAECPVRGARGAVEFVVHAHR